MLTIPASLALAPFLAPHGLAPQTILPKLKKNTDTSWAEQVASDTPGPARKHRLWVHLAWAAAGSVLPPDVPALGAAAGMSLVLARADRQPSAAMPGGYIGRE